MNIQYYHLLLPNKYIIIGFLCTVNIFLQKIPDYFKRMAAGLHRQASSDKMDVHQKAIMQELVCHVQTDDRRR